MAVLEQTPLSPTAALVSTSKPLLAGHSLKYVLRVYWRKVSKNSNKIVSQLWQCLPLISGSCRWTFVNARPARHRERDPDSNNKTKIKSKAKKKKKIDLELRDNHA